MFLAKVGVLYWYSSMKNFFRKIQTIFDVEKWLWKSEICNFVTLSPLPEKVQKFFQCNFCDSASISFIVISFHQISLTWWNAYYRSYFEFNTYVCILTNQVFYACLCLLHCTFIGNFCNQKERLPLQKKITRSVTAKTWIIE